MVTISLLRFEPVISVSLVPLSKDILALHQIR